MCRSAGGDGQRTGKGNGETRDVPQERTIEDERVVTGESESRDEKRTIKDNKQIYVVQVVQVVTKGWESL